MDTEVFTDIVEEIRNTASMCELSDEPLRNVSAWEGLQCGRYMNKILEHVYELSQLYRLEASESLPNALTSLRDGLIEQDKIIARSISGQVISFGGKE
ncbi:hypothetical protein [Butyrivibrio hungatei]|uniref:hypothetical protein n=1 Tax=Butyrivibrio hungatei TaxID=185008 RepID=UPI0009343494|nr:hypothetical protein [Butyrivibrio hungatei]